jgi:hypothetical protein
MPKKSKSTLPTTKKSPSAKGGPTHEEIALRAYQIYLERGGAPGDALEDWTRAERELLGKSSKPKNKVGPTLVAA